MAIETAGRSVQRRPVSDRESGPEADLRLVDDARAGDRIAFGQLYNRYAPMVHGILLARVPHTDAEDLVQDVFVTAMDRLASLRDGAAFGGWLAVIARHRAADFHRRGPREESATERLEGSGPLEAGPPANPDRSSSAHNALDARTALAAVRALPEAYRETLVLRLVEGMTGPEIAERTGLTPASVRVNLCRGMKLLREALGWSSSDE